MYICNTLQANINSESLFIVMLSYVRDSTWRTTISPFHRYQFEIPGSWSSVSSLRLKHEVMYIFFNFASIAAAKKRWAIKRHNLSTWFEIVVLRPYHWQCITRVTNWGKIGEGMVGFLPPAKGFLLWVFGLWCKVSSKLSENCDRERGDSLTDRQKDTQTRVIL